MLGEASHMATREGIPGMTDPTTDRMAKYEVVRDSDGKIVLKGESEIIDGQIRYEGLHTLPVGDYHVHVGVDAWPLSVIPELENDL